MPASTRLHTREVLRCRWLVVEPFSRMIKNIFRLLVQSIVDGMAVRLARATIPRDEQASWRCQRTRVQEPATLLLSSLCCTVRRFRMSTWVSFLAYSMQDGANRCAYPLVVRCAELATCLRQELEATGYSSLAFGSGARLAMTRQQRVLNDARPSTYANDGASEHAVFSLSPTMVSSPASKVVGCLPIKVEGVSIFRCVYYSLAAALDSGPQRLE